MESLRKIVGLIAVAVVPTLTGCATLTGVKNDFASISKGSLTTSAPVVDIACGWQNRLATLPDQTRNGAPTLGIVGQVFLYNTEGKPAEPNGELTISVADAVERGPNGTPYNQEVWHFDNATLKRLAIQDHRFGKSYVIFLPWPEAWRDVTRFKVMARYDQPSGNTIFGQESIVTLDFSSGAGVGPMGVQGGTSFVPNPTEVMGQVKADNARNKKMQQPVFAPAPGMQPVAWNQQQLQQPMQQPKMQQGMMPAGYQVPQQPMIQQGMMPAGYQVPQQPMMQQGMMPAGYQVPQQPMQQHYSIPLPTNNPPAPGGVAPVDIPLKLPGQ